MEFSSLETLAQQKPVIKLVQLILLQAIKDKSSDIHFEPSENEFSVRYRVGGTLYEMMPPPLHLGNAIITAIKAMANISTVEHRRALHGRISLKISSHPIDLLVDCVPCAYGERITIRVIDPSAQPFDLAWAGLRDKEIEMIDGLMHLSQGLVLVTGPPAGGKTHLLYSLSNHLQRVKRSVFSIEDRPACNMKHVTQVSPLPDSEDGLREAIHGATLQACDVLLVDAPWFPERLETIVRAASEGRLVIAVLPATDAATAIFECVRVADSAEWLASNLKGVISRRLARKLCAKCRREIEPPTPTNAVRELIERLGINNAFEAPGCESCNSGLHGQVALHELLRIRDPLAADIRAGEYQRIKSYADTQAELSLLTEGARLLSEGANEGPPLLS